MLHTDTHPKNTRNNQESSHYYDGYYVWVGIFTALLGILQFFQPELVYQRHLISQGQWWRLWTGNLVHTNGWHLLLNLGGFWLLAMLNRPWLSPGNGLILITWLGSFVGIGLWVASPAVIWYAGFSGILYGLFLLAGLYGLYRRDWLTALVLLGGVCGKTLWDAFHTGNSLSADLIGAPVVYAAHGYGMVGAGLLAAIVYYRYCRR